MHAARSTSGDAPGADVRRLPPWLSFACRHREAYRAVERYLRYLAQGLDHIGPEPVHLVLHVVAPTGVPGVPRGAVALPPRDGHGVARFRDERIYAVARRRCVRIDPAKGTASIWTTTFDHASVSELLSIALLELASHRGFFGLHAGAVVRDGVGYLLSGASGSGKTSLCLTLTRAGFRYLTDDFVLLEADRDTIRCLPFFRTFNIDTSWAERFPELSFLREVPPVAGGKQTVDPEQCYPGSHAPHAHPTVIVFPLIVAAASSEVIRLTGQDAFCRLLRQSRLSVDARTAEAHARTLATLVRGSVAFELRHGADFLRAPVATARRLFESLGSEPAAPDAR